MKNLCEIQVVDFEEYTDLDFREVSSFWIKNCLGQRVYFKTRSRETATLTCDELYGKNFYKVNSGKLEKKSSTESAVGRLNSKSRAGMRNSS